MVNISSTALTTFSEILVSEILEPETYDRISLQGDLRIWLEHDRSCLAPNPASGYRYEIGYITPLVLSEDKNIAVGFGTTSVLVPAWNVKPFTMMEPFAKLITYAVNAERRGESEEVINAIALEKPEFLIGMTDETTLNHIIAKGISHDAGFTVSELINIIGTIEGTSSIQTATRLVAIRNIYTKLLNRLFDNQIETEVKKHGGTATDRREMMYYMIHAHENGDAKARDLLDYPGIRVLEYEKRTATKINSYFSEGMVILPGEIITDVFYDHDFGFIYMMEQDEVVVGTLLPLICDRAPQLHNSAYRWWPPMEPGNYLTHFRDAFFKGPKMPYAVAEDVHDNGRVFVVFEDHMMEVPQHLMTSVVLGPDSNAVTGVGFNKDTNIQFLDFVETPDGTKWRVQNFKTVSTTVYRGAFSTVVDNIRLKKSELGELEYENGIYVLLQVDPETLKSRFVILESRYNEHHIELEYCCLPIGIPGDTRGIVWLPGSAIYSVEMWFAELQRPDPLPVSIIFPRPMLHLNSEFDIQGTMAEEGSLATRIKLPHRKQKGISPMVIGGATVALYLLLDT